MSFLDAREHGSKVGSGGHASAQNEVCASALRRSLFYDLSKLQHSREGWCASSSVAAPELISSLVRIQHRRKQCNHRLHMHQANK